MKPAPVDAVPDAGTALPFAGRRALLVGLAVLGAAATDPGAAMFASMSDAELLAASDVVVVGRLAGSSEITPAGSGATLHLGALVPSEVLKGPPGIDLVLIELPRRNAPRSGSDVTFRTGDQGLWLLRRRADTGTYLADHPQRFVPAAVGQARIEALRRLLRPR
jgi:hypothetical protein